MRSSFGGSPSEVAKCTRSWHRIFLPSPTSRYFRTRRVTHSDRRTIAFGVVQGLKDIKRDASMAIRTAIIQGAPVELYHCQFM